MKLLTNDVFDWRKSTWRLLKADANVAYVIDIVDPKAEPQRINRAELDDCRPKEPPKESVLKSLKVSEKSQKFLDKKWAREKPLYDNVDLLLDPEVRTRLVPEIAEEIGCAPATLQASLRRYWQRGQCKAALLPDYRNSGRRQGGVTAGRGRTTTKYAIYQLQEADIEYMKQVIDEKYLKDDRWTIIDTYDNLVDTRYQVTDGNGDSFERPLGERPSERQFRNFLTKYISREKKIRCRKGEKEFIRNHAPALSDTIRDCLGVGHKYEIDASIADVLIVSQFDRRKVIGKATVYFIIDRRSRLIVGFYVGLEHASWDTALEAILSCFEDKQELCRRYGVEYRSTDWPAHRVMPATFVADHAELTSRYSDALTAHFNATVENPTAEAPNFKPVVETQFSLLKVSLRTLSGYEPPENRGKRRQKNHAKDAALTLQELMKEILEHVIAHNRAPLNVDIRSPDQIIRKVEKSPIALWNDGVVQRSGLGRRYDHSEVLQYLMPTETATISRKEIGFKSLYYTSDDPILRRMLVDLGDRKDTIRVSFDRRIVDTIYLWTDDTRAVPATLAGACTEYAGLSFAEVAYIERIRKQSEPASQQQARDVRSAQRASRRRTEEGAKFELKTYGRQSLRSRTISTRQTRAEEKRKERSDLAERRYGDLGPTQPFPNIVGMRVTNAGRDATPSTNGDAVGELSDIQKARRRMIV